jgi:hypothetical protein
MFRGQESQSGLSPRLFERFEEVYSGHFHPRSRKGNIRYLGSHSDFTWTDHGDERGFHVLDLDTRELEFVENPFSLHVKIHYPSSVRDLNERCRGRFVKVIVDSVEDQNDYVRFVDEVQSSDPISVQVVDDHLNTDTLVQNVMELDGTEDTLSLLRGALEDVEVSVPKTRLDDFLTTLYTRAINNQ